MKVISTHYVTFSKDEHGNPEPKMTPLLLNLEEIAFAFPIEEHGWHLTQVTMKTNTGFGFMLREDFETLLALITNANHENTTG